MKEQAYSFIDPRNRSDRILCKEILIPARQNQVWDAWTTSEGAMTFFSPKALVELFVSGRYEIYFYPNAPQGSRGSEDCRVLSYLPKEMLSFSWNAPVEFGELRSKHTIVVLRFEQTDPGTVKVFLWHHGWGKGEQWDKLFDYFDRAWSHVLGNLKKRFAAGPIDWQAR
jgi:uncharacterized protein YndB with AHSA1/START domain